MLLTRRLELVPATPALARATASLGVVVPLTCPPEFLDSRSLEFILARLAEGPERQGYASETLGGLIGEGSEPGVIRFELRRAEYSTG